jgi:hypothetical protein
MGAGRSLSFWEPLSFAATSGRGRTVLTFPLLPPPQRTDHGRRIRVPKRMLGEASRPSSEPPPFDAEHVESARGADPLARIRDYSGRVIVRENPSQGAPLWNAVAERDSAFEKDGLQELQVL